MFRYLSLIPALVFLSLPAHATLSWSFTTPSGVNYGQTGNFNGSSGAVNVIVNAFSTTGETGSDGNPQFAGATLGSWSGGIGVSGAEDGSFGSAPGHAFDNDGGANNTSGDERPAGDVDAAVFAFTQSVSLSTLSIGWYSGDSDLSVLAYTGNNGNSMPNPGNISGQTFSDLLNSGWEFIGNYLNVHSMPSDTATINNLGISSSYWLVSAYTSCANGNCSTSDPYFGNDYFKISGLGGNLSTSGGGGSGNNNSVPEPSSLLLISVGFLGGWRLHRSQKACDSLAA